MSDDTALRVTIQGGGSEEYRIARLVETIERLSGVASVEEVSEA